jgi:hypothetical protein
MPRLREAILSTSGATRDQALVVNIAKRGRDVLNDPSVADDAVMGNWSPYRGRSAGTMDFDPDRIAVVIGYFRGRMAAIFEVTPDDNGHTWNWCPDHRIRFNGVPSKRFAAQVGSDAPVNWRQGEAWPVKTIPLDDLIKGDALVSETASGRRTVLGDVVITATADGGVTVTIAPGSTLTVRATA